MPPTAAAVLAFEHRPLSMKQNVTDADEYSKRNTNTSEMSLFLRISPYLMAMQTNTMDTAIMAMKRAYHADQCTCATPHTG